jgi:phage baseplate assembly protein W
MAMASDFLGQGWRFPIIPDASGGLGYVSGDANVEQSVRIVLLTALGERVMRPGFGTRARSSLFTPGSVQALRMLEVSIRDALVEFEPRVDVESVRAEANVDEPSRVDVDVRYLIRRTNSRHNLVFPYYLGQSERP